ncbi:MAG: cytochrome c peroxidase [Nannocystaceae bacterium]
MDDRLREALSAARIGPLDFGDRPKRELRRLGEALFYDKVLSGNRDIACGTCHRPASRTSDDRSLSIGTGGSGSGPGRVLGTGVLTLRHAPELFNRGADGWRSLMWDGRLEDGERWPAPAGVRIPEAAEDELLAVQAMLQVGDRASMRGWPDDVGVDGEPNELSEFSDGQLAEVWDALMDRLLAYGEYRALFDAAFPLVPPEQLGFEHAALALAAYQVDAFTLDDSPWDDYLGGDDAALVEPAKRGALLFYGEARCSECHSGPLLTDQQFHNVCTPQVGTGLDWGRGGYTGVPEQRYQFRTPPLRNIGFTGPYFHAGTHDSIEDALEYHLDPCDEMRDYNGRGLDDQARELLLVEDSLFDEIEQSAAPIARTRIDLDSDQLADLVQFLEALSDPGVVYDIIDEAPDRVPSGLPVD